MIKTINNIFYKLFGSKHDRDIKKMQPAVKLISLAEILTVSYTNEELKNSPETG